tara:strand:- start:102 stop:671 length:570 start_codon:yes stop_codon:yes gene_type:complete
MRIFIAVVVFIFSLQFLTKADDIRDFQIEGMSIGDNLLDYYSKVEIKSNEKKYYKKKDYIPVWIKNSNFKDYDGVQFHYQKIQTDYIIVGIEGIIFYKDNMEDCYKKMNEIDKIFMNSFSSLKRKDYGITKHPGDKSGKSTAKDIVYFFNSEDAMYVKCFDWSKKMGFGDNLRVGLKTKELNHWYSTAY